MNIEEKFDEEKINLEEDCEEMEIDQSINYKKYFLIGTWILMVFFILFPFSTLFPSFSVDIYYLIFRNYNDEFIAICYLILSIVSLGLLNFGLYYFVKDLRPVYKPSIESKDKSFLIFNSFFEIILIITTMLSLSFSSFVFYDVFIGRISEATGWTLFFIFYFTSFIFFGLTIIMVGIQSFILNKKEIIDYGKVRKPFIHYIMLGSLIIWLFFLINMFVRFMGDYRTSIVYFVCSQVLTSFLAAGVYLELAIKIRKTKALEN